jgi:hypothetical protein
MATSNLGSLVSARHLGQSGGLVIGPAHQLFERLVKHFPPLGPVGLVTPEYRSLESPDCPIHEKAEDGYHADHAEAWDGIDKRFSHLLVSLQEKRADSHGASMARRTCDADPNGW